MTPGRAAASGDSIGHSFTAHKFPSPLHPASSALRSAGEERRDAISGGGRNRGRKICDFHSHLSFAHRKSKSKGGRRSREKGRIGEISICKRGEGSGSIGGPILSFPASPPPVYHACVHACMNGPFPLSPLPAQTSPGHSSAGRKGFRERK